MNILRLLEIEAADGAWNMAVDEYLLRQAAAGEASLRFYSWQQPTLSLGYFQSVSHRQQHRASQACPLVRRASGGGAIVHDLELTYSIALPLGGLAGDRMRRPSWLYDVMHQTLIQTLVERGISARQCQQGSHRQTREVFLCFQRHTPGDVLIGNHKVAGSAQRRYQGGLLQHGSILLSTSQAAPELPGVAQLAQVKLEAEELIESWLPRIHELWQVRPRPLTTDERKSIAAIQQSKFGTSDWTHRR